MFNNSKFGSMKNAQRKHFYNYKEEEGFVPPPPENYFLLDNSGELLLDNSDEPFITEK